MRDSESHAQASRDFGDAEKGSERHRRFDTFGAGRGSLEIAIATGDEDEADY